MSESPASDQPAAGARCYIVPGIILMASLAVFGYALNWSSPWESDQSAKAAQIIEIADANDYLLSDSLTRCYSLKLLTLYYAISALVYKAVGGPIFTFMNLSSVVAGTMTVLSAAYAVRNAFGIHPLWSALVLLSMPLVVISSTYGNEAIWAFAFFTLSLWLLTSPTPWFHYTGGVAMACAIFCRADMVLAAPFWIAWATLFGPAATSRKAIVRRLAVLGVVSAATAAVLWLLLVREIPQSPLTFEWKTNYLLIAAFLSYPFNPSVVVMAAVGWLMMWKLNRRYAPAHLLLLTTLLFYFGMLASPKYILLCVLFYGIPAALLLQRSNWPVRAAALAAILFWWVIGVSVFGGFGPARAALWYVPSVDGPIPSGGYVAFYARARNGFYQAKQEENIVLTSKLAEAAQQVAPDVRLVGQYSVISTAYVRCVRRQQGNEIDPLTPPLAEEGDTRFVMVRTGYFGLGRSAPEWLGKIRAYLEIGQVRPVFANDEQPFPEVIEVGEQVPAGANPSLGRRIAFLQDFYQGHMVFLLPEFVPAYAATSWLPSDDADWAPIYQDEEYSGFDREITGAQQVLGFPWPARLYNFRPPRAHF